MESVIPNNIRGFSLQRAKYWNKKPRTVAYVEVNYLEAPFTSP